MNAHTSHPEAGPGEILLCYATPNGYALIGYESKRKGSHVPLDIVISRGTRREDYFPVFVDEGEITDPGIRRQFRLPALAV